MGDGALSDAVCRRNDELRAACKWAPFDISDAVGRCDRAQRPDGWHLRDWPGFLVWLFNGTAHRLSLWRIAESFGIGCFGLVSVIVLCLRRQTRHVGIILAVTAAAEFIPIMLAAAPTSRYLLYLQPLWYLANWLLIGMIVDRVWTHFRRKSAAHVLRPV